MMPQNRYYEDYRSTGHSTSPQGLAPATARALHQAHDSARRAFERGATVSRVFNWLQLYNNPAPSSGERSRERWNHEIGTRVGAAAASEAAIGPQLVLAMQGGMLLVAYGSDSSTGSPAPLSPGDDRGQQGRATVPRYQGDVPNADAKPDGKAGADSEPPSDKPDAPMPGEKPELPYSNNGNGGNGELFWDFVL